MPSDLIRQAPRAQFFENPRRRLLSPLPGLSGGLSLRVDGD